METPEMTPEFNAEVAEALGKEAPAAVSTPDPAAALDKAGDDTPGEHKDGEIDEKVLADIKAGTLIPKHRFDEHLTKFEELSQRSELTAKELAQLNEKVKLYQSFGSPEELKAKLEAIAKKAEAPGVELTEEERELREHLLGKVTPELKDVSEVKKMLNELIAEKRQEKEQANKVFEAELKTHNLKAIEKIKDLAKEMGLPVEDKTNLKVLANGIADLIEDNPEWVDAYYKRRDLSILKEVVENYQQRFFSGIQRKAAADIVKGKKAQEALPKAPIGGGTPPTEAPQDVSKLDWDEVNKGVIEKLKSGTSS